MSDHDHPSYVKIWGILLVLLVISILGPELEIQIVTLVTAFGIAIVKAYMVAKNFMHLSFEPRFVTYIVATALVFMLLFFAAVAPDVMAPEGTQWLKPSWIERWHTSGLVPWSWCMHTGMCGNSSMAARIR